MIFSFAEKKKKHCIFGVEATWGDLQTFSQIYRFIFLTCFLIFSLHLLFICSLCEVQPFSACFCRRPEEARGGMILICSDFHRSIGCSSPWQNCKSPEMGCHSVACSESWMKQEVNQRQHTGKKPSSRPWCEQLCGLLQARI